MCHHDCQEGGNESFKEQLRQKRDEKERAQEEKSKLERLLQQEKDGRTADLERRKEGKSFIEKTEREAKKSKAARVEAERRYEVAEGFRAELDAARISNEEITRKLEADLKDTQEKLEQVEAGKSVAEKDIENRNEEIRRLRLDPEVAHHEAENERGVVERCRGKEGERKRWSDEGDQIEDSPAGPLSGSTPVDTLAAAPATEAPTNASAATAATAAAAPPAQIAALDDDDHEYDSDHDVLDAQVTSHSFSENGLVGDVHEDSAEMQSQLIPEQTSTENVVGSADVGEAEEQVDDSGLAISPGDQNATEAPTNASAATAATAVAAPPIQTAAGRYHHQRGQWQPRLPVRWPPRRGSDTQQQQELCWYHQRGRCRKGERCSFLHAS